MNIYIIDIAPVIILLIYIAAYLIILHGMYVYEHCGYHSVLHLNTIYIINFLVYTKSSYADLCPRSRYQGQGQVITSHSICGM